MKNDQGEGTETRKSGGAREKAVALGAVVFILLGAGAVAFTASHGASAQPKVLASSRASINIDVNKPGPGVRTDSFGISLEVADITNSGFGTGNLVQHLKTLGSGVLRIGGDSADDTFWTSSGEQAPEWAKYTLTPKNLEKLASVANKSGWRVILGLNLEHSDPTRTADEVTNAIKTLGDKLKAVSIGNEPEYYYSDATKFWNDYKANADVIDKLDHTPKIVGPEFSDSLSQDVGAKFNDNAVKNKDIAALSLHHYSQSACEGSNTDPEKLLSPDTYSADKKVANDLVDAAKKVGIGAFLTETNSAACDGKKGVSDTYTSSLWSLDYGLAMANAGVDGVYFSGNLETCGSKEQGFKWYSPLCSPSGRDIANGKVVAQPEFYGLLALHQAGAGTFVGVDNPRWGDIRTYAIKNGSRLKVVIINVANPAKHAATPVSLRVNGSYAQATQTVLSNKSHKLTATHGTTYGGQALTADGTIGVPKASDLFVAGDLIETTVNAGSALVISLS